MGDTLTKKELVDIGGRPLLWHVLRIFSAYDHNQFVLALGHLGEQLRRYFLEYEAMSSDVTLQLGQPDHINGQTKRQYTNHPDHQPWDVTLVDTGKNSEKGSRIGRVRNYLMGHDRFFVAYGEAVSDIDLADLVAFHEAHGRLATITGIQVSFQYGVIEADDGGHVNGFAEKPPLPYWINGGFMIFEREVLDLIDPDRQDVDLEQEILPQLAAQEQLMLYRHTGYWQSMKTLKDALTLKRDWEKSQPWKVWQTESQQP